MIAACIFVQCDIVPCSQNESLSMKCGLWLNCSSSISYFCTIDAKKILLLAKF